VPDVRAFTGYLYDPEIAGPLDAVTAPPYDTISPVDQDRYYRASPYNVIRLILGKEEPGDDGSLNKYSRAASYLREWRDEGVITATDRPSVFPYEMRFHLEGRERRVRGIIAEVALEPWGGSIVAHERTMIGPIEDRLTLLRTVKANLSPIYGVFAGPDRDLARFMDEAMAAPPGGEVTDEMGTRHRLWVSPGGAPRVADAVAGQPLMIADGHHRYTVALAYRDEMHRRLGPGPWDAMMVLVVDAGAEDPPVLPIHRVLAGTQPFSDPGGERVRDMAEVLASLHDDDLTVGIVHLEEGQPVHRVLVLSGHPPTVCELHDQLLDRLDPADLRFVPDAVAAERLVLSGDGSIAFLLPPTRVDRVRTVIQDGGRLPQKSTYFWPKPRTGMVIRPFQP
jgi:uncharacterized protein (DUF1015 family)